MIPLRVLIPVLVLAYGLMSIWPSWRSVTRSKHARDYATYHYAVAEALDGGDPYNTRALSKRARDEGTRRSVHPYFYPPPFLMGMAWTRAFDLLDGYRVFFWLTQLALAGVLWVCRRWFSAPVLLLGILACTLTPLTDSAKMGQANMLVLLLALLGLWRSNGVALAAAGMSKMSPALYLFAWGAQKAWKPFLWTAGSAIGLSVLSLSLVGVEEQVRFYTEVLPGFSTGNYHGLRVKIALPANHSIPDMFHQYWPGPDAHTLSDVAQRGARAVSLVVLAGLVWLARVRRDVLGQACLFGAFTILLLITPVYTYEHHLSMVIFPAAALGTALVHGRLGRWGWLVAVPAYFFVAWPLYWLRPLQKEIPALKWYLQESKFFGLVVLGLLCVLVVLRSPRDTDGEA